ncbi:Type 2A phosphatase-associated protein 42 [Nakaseomyces bracarensis]|uniref:Type 2A phosphatase-associated protein 42 n=1 Tax=Nakaseomyces bracarensis TaxID=273131 RepID=A0ABR4NXV4_9SACH
MSNISEKYESLLKNIDGKLVHTSLRQDSEEYQKLLTGTIQEVLDLKSTVYHKLALFSSNETVDDIATSSLKFLSIDYYLGILCSRKQATSAQMTNPMDKNKVKIMFLEKSVQLFMQFLSTLQDNEMLDQTLSKRIDGFENTFMPKLDELFSQPKHKEDLSGAQLRRLEKIEMHRQNVAVAEQLKNLESKLKSEDEDDELLRKLYLQKLKQLSFEAYDEIEKILYEKELLSNFVKMGPVDIEQTDNHNRDKEEDSTDPTRYTEKLETLNKPLLSKQGKVLRNFTLVDKKTELRNKVKGYGQYGPTMSVEELLEQEWEQGRVLQGGPEPTKEEIEAENEDNLEWHDKETYKAREWDEFKEENPRGSGNTMNRG